MAQSALIAKNRATTPKQFSFVLNNATQGSLTLAFAPDGWEDDEYVMTRDMKSFGVFRKFAAAEMKFVKDSRDYVRDVYEADGVNADCTFTVSEITSLLVSRVRFAGKLDFSTYKITELSADIQVIDGAFTDLVLTRAKTDVNLLGLKAIDGAVLSPINLDAFIIPEINIDQVAYWVARDTTEVLNQNHSLQVSVNANDYVEAQSTTGIADPFFLPAIDEYLGLIFTFDIQAVIDGSDNLDEFTWDFALEILDGVTVISTIYTDSYSTTGHLPATKNMADSVTFDLAVGQSLKFRAEITNTSGAGTIKYNRINYNIYLNAESIPERTFMGLLYHQAFARIIEHYTGSAGKFKSDFFGTMLLGYTADGTALGGITTGRYIRQKSAHNDTFPVSLESLFTSMQAIYCLGLGVETISGASKVVIEPMAHFFDDNVIIDISTRIAEETIEKQVATDLIYNRISVGYNAFDYGRLGGIYEFNTTSKFTNVIKPVDKELQIIAPYRADMSGVISIAKEPVENRDVSGEKDIFIMDAVLTGGEYIIRTTEGFSAADNDGNKDILLNLLITPARNLYRWGAYLRGFLDKYITSSLIWQTSDKNTKLTTTLTAGTALLENANVLVSDLADPLWHPETFTIEVPALEADITAIQTNPYGLIKISATEYGWILNYKSKNENKKSEFKLLRCNTDYVTPVEIPS